MPFVNAQGPLHRCLTYEKFMGKSHKILLLDSNYHVHNECRAGLQQLGHTVIPLLIGGTQGAQNAAASMRQLLHAMVQHRPDMLLAVNHIGFDAHNSMGELLDEIHMPVAVWYVDSPFLLFDGYFLPAPAMTTTFVWDKSYVAMLTACGAQSVHYLPLATDAQKFAPKASHQPPLPAGFVGNSMRFAQAKWQRLLTAKRLKQGNKLALQLLRDRQTFVALAGRPERPPDPQMTTLAFATWKATGAYRQQLLQAMNPRDLHVFGDEGWADILPRAHLSPHVWYGEAVAELYGRCICNINATSLQMPSAVNQRVFDVPAAGGFVLTDRQEDVFELFDPTEMITYESPEQLVDLVAYYQRHSAARQTCVERGRVRVLKDHTYDKRLTRLVATVEARWHAGAFT